MNDEAFAKHLLKATGLAASSTTEALRAAEKALSEIGGPRVAWATTMLHETRWRLAVRHAEVTKKRTHYGFQATWRDKGDLAPFCGTARFSRGKVEHQLAGDPLEVTCVKCWRRLKTEAEERLASFEVARKAEQ